MGTKYTVRINKRVKNVRIYKIIKKTTPMPNLLTKAFIRIFTGKKREEI